MRSFIQLSAALGGYLAVLIASQQILSHEIPGTWLRVALALAPMLPAATVCAIVVQSFRRMDEFQRKLQFEALALSFAGTALVTFGYGFLEGSGFPKLSMFAVWPLMATLWVVGTVIGHLRFR